jgi:hypothetical protein
MYEIELLWFEDCPNYQAARHMIDEVVAEVGAQATIAMVEVEDDETGRLHGFPGSPTIRVDGRDIEPSFEPCAECAPRCRVYAIDGRLTGLPDRQWLVAALAGAAHP